MGIIIRLDRIMADRKVSLNELAQNVGITNANMSILKTGKAKASITFSSYYHHPRSHPFRRSMYVLPMNHFSVTIFFVLLVISWKASLFFSAVSLYSAVGRISGFVWSFSALQG